MADMLPWYHPLRALQSLYLWLHRRTFAKRQRNSIPFEHARVVSVGNLSAGGTGKTPMALLLLRYAVPPSLVVLRGYKGKASPGELLVHDHTGTHSTAVESGDEAMLFARYGHTVAIGRDRARVIQRFGKQARLILLDDAFQNPSVRRDHDLVLIDATVPPEKNRLIPGGRLREPFEALKRAHTIVLTRADLCTPSRLDQYRRVIEEASRGADLRVFEAEHRLVRPERLPAGARVAAFAGIGNPEAFFVSLKELGLTTIKRIAFPDHHGYRAGEISAMLGETPDQIWVTTEKDFVRLESLDDSAGMIQKRIIPIPMRMQIRNNEERAFLERVLGDKLRG